MKKEVEKGNAKQVEGKIMEDIGKAMEQVRPG